MTPYETWSCKLYENESTTTAFFTYLPGATDNSRYGDGGPHRSSRSFLTHHVANISTAIQAADAQTILNAASARMLRVSYGVL